MKNKQTKGLSLSLSANPIHLIRGTFYVATEAFAGFNRNSNILTLKKTLAWFLLLDSPRDDYM